MKGSSAVAWKVLRTRFLLPMTPVSLPVTQSRQPLDRIEDAFVLIKDDVIDSFGEYTPRLGRQFVDQYGSSLRIIGSESTTPDPSLRDPIPQLDAVALPGFVKCHGHEGVCVSVWWFDTALSAGECALIGIHRDEPLLAWLNHSVFPFGDFLESHLDSFQEAFDGRSAVDVLLAKARLDDIRYGITTNCCHAVADMKWHVEEVVRANDIAGTRVVVAVGSSDRDNYPIFLDDSPDVAIERLNRFREEFHDGISCDVIPGPDHFFSNSPEMLRSLKQWADEHDCLMHIHSSEEPKKTAWFFYEYQKTPLEYGVDCGIVDDRLMVSHQVNNTHDDLEILQDYGVRVVHNPLANSILGSGMPPLIEMEKRGIDYAISTDGQGSADNVNILNAARVAAQFQKARLRNPQVLPSEDVLSRITSFAARVLGKDELVGTIEEGKKADLVVADLTRWNLIPTRTDNLVENLVWASNGNEISYVICDGELLMEEGKVTTLDEAQVLDDIVVLADSFARDHGLL